MAKQKFYVVWQGRKPGIYTSWKECEAQVSGFENAQYKAFDSMVEAEKAFSEIHGNTLISKRKNTNKHPFLLPNYERKRSGGCSLQRNPGKWNIVEFTLQQEKRFFISALLKEVRTISEIFGIVHALALLNNKTVQFLFTPTAIMR